MKTNPSKLHHENLDVYQAAISFLAVSARIWKSWPRGYGSLADQYRLAATPIPLNIAEGVGRRSNAESRQFFGIAKGSAHECGAILDAGKILGLIEDEQCEEAKMKLVRIVSMLVRLAGF